MKPDRVKDRRFTPGRFVAGLTVVEASLRLADWLGWLTLPKGHAVLAAVAVAGLGVSVLLVWCIVSLALKKSFQFSIRSLLALTLIVAIPTSWMATAMDRARRQRVAVEGLLEADCGIGYTPILDGRLSSLSDVSSPSLLTRLLGADFFENVLEAGDPRYTRSSGIFRPTDMVHFRELPDVRVLSLNLSTDLLNLKAPGDVTPDEHFTDASLENLRHMTRLRRLDISNSDGISDAGLEHLKGLSQLRRLRLSACRRITDKGLAYLEDIRGIRELCIWNASVTGNGLDRLPCPENLRCLGLSMNPITDAGASRLGRFAHLQELGLSNTPLTDAGLRHVAKLGELEHLFLDDTRITDAGLEHLRGLTKLRTLTLGQTKVTDAGLKWLESFHDLEQLDLTKTNVTDAGLKYLENLRRLKTLDVADTKVTDAGRRRLKRLSWFQNLDLEHSVMVFHWMDSEEYQSDYAE